MNKKLLFTIWAILFAICAGFGFMKQPEGAVRVLGILFSLGFFCVGGFLLWQARGRKDRAVTALVRNLALASLVTTSVLLVANFLSVFWSDTLGHILHYVLIIVSSPMFCAPNWATSLFLWACLMAASQRLLKQMK